jgi:dihydropteroate synthase
MIPSTLLAADHPLRALLAGPPPWVMGIVNVTPDSFSDGGLHLSPAAALKAVTSLCSAGAALIDIGGESTRLGSTRVSAEEELRRVEPIVAASPKHCVVSIDTYKSEVAARCLDRGARIINDVSALRADPAMAKVIAERGAFVVLMHNKEPGDRPHASDSPREYKNVIEEICDFFNRRIDVALAEGIVQVRIVLDPGMGKFLSHDPAYSWEALARFDEFTRLGFPLLVGTSRKGFLGKATDERDPLSALSSLVAAMHGASILRVHDAQMASDFIRAARQLKLLDS